MSYISDMRKFVGHAPIMAVAAMAILYNEEKGMLLEKRTDTGEWCTPGGAIELGESLEDALKREIKEETNLDFANPKLFDIKANVHMVYPNKDEVYYTDVVYVISKFWGDLKPDGESTELRFFDLDNKKESNNDESLSKFFASFGDVFINDAFGVSHRSAASNVGISKYLDSANGFLVEEEVNNLKAKLDKATNDVMAASNEAGQANIAKGNEKEHLLEIIGEVDSSLTIDNYYDNVCQMSPKAQEEGSKLKDQKDKIIKKIEILDKELGEIQDLKLKLEGLDELIKDKENQINNNKLELKQLETNIENIKKELL